MREKEGNPSEGIPVRLPNIDSKYLNKVAPIAKINKKNGFYT